jgi:hypothetical protein
VLSCIRDITNPRDLGTGVEEIRLKVSVIDVLPRVRTRMMFMPYPLVDVPRGDGCVNCICSIWLSLKSFGDGDDILVPKLPCGRDPKINVLDGFIRSHCASPTPQRISCAALWNRRFADVVALRQFLERRALPRRGVVLFEGLPGEATAAISLP